MSPANPAVDPPRLPSPTKRAFRSPSPSRSRSSSHSPSHSPSPSRSPVRHRARDYDPLLRDLSPTKTLRAFAASSPDAEPDFLSRSLETASNSERALGAKAARACADLRSWARELEQWHWPGTFDVPESVRKRQRMSGGSLWSMRPASPDNEPAEEEYSGSLPAPMVRAYEARLDEIEEDLDAIDVEELKDFVLAAHSQAGMGEASIDDSIGAIGAATDLGRLDDFTALITATILQALPYLSRLARSLHAWAVRLSILHAAPSYLRDLRQARTDLDHGWAALAVAPHSASAEFGEETMDEMRGVISRQVQSLGRRLDSFLDELEGRDETVPGSWIDDFETLEASYAEWVVRAERKVHENEWRRAKRQEDETQKNKSSESLLRADAGLIRRTLNKMGAETSDAPANGDAGAAGSPSPKGRQTDTNGFAEAGEKTATPRSTSRSPTKRSRAWPKTLAVNESVHKAPSSEQLTALPLNATATTPRDVSPAVTTGSQTDSVPNVRKRAAFLNRDIETSDRLNKSKPPPIVRPFEHASNAFTRLFKRDSQASSNGSDTAESEKESKSFRRKSFGKRNLKDRVVSNKENIQPNSEKLTYGDLTAVPKAREPEDTTRRSRDLSRDGWKSQAESASADKSAYYDLAAVPMRESEESRRPRPRTPKRIVPATYQPTTLASPFREEHTERSDDEFPENWPLSESVTPQEALSPTDDKQEDFRALGPALSSRDALGHHSRTPTFQAGVENDYDELRLHQTAPDTETLEEIFVQSITNTPTSSRPASRRSAMPLHRSHASRESAVTRSSIFSTEELARRSLEIERHQKREQPESSVPTGIAPVQEEASPEKTTPPQPPVDFEVDDNAIFGSSPRSNERGSKISRSSALPTSPELARLHIPDDSQASGETRLPDAGGGKQARTILRQASVQSIETVPRSELRSVDIAPRSPTTPGGDLPTPIEPIAEDGPQIPQDRISPITGPSSPVSPYGHEASFGLSTPPDIPERRSSMGVSPSVHRRQTSETPSSPPPMDDHNLAAVPFSKTKSKRIHEDAPVLAAKSPPRLRVTKREAGETMCDGDNFDRHVSEVLDRVHAPIRFKSRPGAETPQSPTSRPEGKAKSYSRLQQPRLERQQTRSMTLVPAESSPKKSSTSSEPEVKLYHLTQVGRTEPVKLFVRLVGDGERVMVRVGGGWADLADYLRQYAEHHGSRTVSGGMLEVQTAVGAGASSATGARRTFSTPAVSAAEPKSASAGRAATPMLERVVTTTGPGEHAGAREERPSWLHDPQPRFAMGDSDESDHTNTPTPITPTFSSRPGTANGTATNFRTLSSSRPGSRQAGPSIDTNAAAGSSPASFSMAGPSSAKGTVELPEQKARWVEGMLAKARHSAEKSEKFAEMGRVRGTRRVIFRGRGTGEKEREK